MWPNPSNRFADAGSFVPNQILVVASPAHAVELLRWATLRSDDVLFVSPVIDDAARQFATRYAVDVRPGSLDDADFGDASALLLALDDEDAENAIIRQAWRHGVAIHVRGRPLVSDFTILAMMEQPWLAHLQPRGRATLRSAAA